MQKKAINFTNYIADMVDRYVPDNEDKSKYVDLLRHHFDVESNFNTFFYVILPALCQQENSKDLIIRTRSLKDDISQQEKTLANLKLALTVLHDITKNLLSLNDSDLLAILVRISLYINCFTDMYLKK